MAGKFGIFLCFILISILVSSSFAEEEKKFVLKIRGMHPNDLKQLRSVHSETPKTFSCKDGSKKIPFEQVNDDYCDCEDASDEPGTSACPNGSFYCRNIGFVGKSIPSSRVSDGICDCCDGSDEKGNNQVSCKNTCAADAREANKGKQQELDSTLRGLSQKKEYLTRYQTEINEKKEKAARFEQELEELRKKKADAEELKNQLLKEENEARDKLKPKEASEQPQETQPPQQEGEDHPDSHYEEHDNPDHYDVDQGDAADEEGDVEEEEEARRNEESTQAPVTPEDESLKPFIEATRNQEKVVNGFDSEIRDRERELEELRKVTSFDFGSNPAFYALFGQCFKADTPEYTYEVCPFDKVNQISKRGGGTTSLGTWNAGDQTDAWRRNQSEMKFTNGVRCWGGPDRSAIVKVVCGHENTASDPAEPNKCEYSLTLTTPAACDETRAEQLKNDINGKHEDDEDEEKPKSSWW